MESAIGWSLQAVLLLGITYAAVFGGAGALFARSVGASPTLGFFAGLFPPVGWPLIYFRGRRQRAADAFIDQTVADDTLLAPLPAGFGAGRDPNALLDELLAEGED